MDYEAFEIYLNSDIIERDGMAFLSTCFTESEYLKLKERTDDPVRLQTTINHVHITWEIEEDFDKGLDIAIQLQKRWMEKLQEKFPNKGKYINITNINGHEWMLELFVRG